MAEISVQPPVKQNNNSGSLDKLLLILLFIITITQFSGWGYQSVKFILASLFSVEIDSTMFDTIIGFMAMIASAIIFVGCVLWWKQKQSAQTYFYFGPLLFMIKNIFDIINEVILMNLRVARVELVHIEQLAGKIGNELFQLAFWVFIFFYFKSKINKKNREELELSV